MKKHFRCLTAFLLSLVMLLSDAGAFFSHAGDDAADEAYLNDTEESAEDTEIVAEEDAEAFAEDKAETSRDEALPEEAVDEGSSAAEPAEIPGEETAEEDEALAMEEEEGLDPRDEEEALKEADAADNGLLWVAGLLEVYPYTGKAVKPRVRVYLGKRMLTENVDYTVSYSNNKKASTNSKPASLTIKGKGNFSGSKKIKFLIVKDADISVSEDQLIPAEEKIELNESRMEIVIGGGQPVAYRKGGAKPEVNVSFNGVKLWEGADYTLKYSSNKKVGSGASVTIKGKGRYKGSVTRSFEIVKADVSELMITASDKVYSDKADAYKKTKLCFYDESLTDQKLKAGKDYSLEFTAPDTDTPAVGSVITLKLDGTGDNYTGSVMLQYRIIEKGSDISKAKVKVNGGKSYPWTGEYIVPAPGEILIKLSGTEVRDYDIVYCTANRSKGTARMLLKGKGSYGGYKPVKYKVAAAKLSTLWGMKERNPVLPKKEKHIPVPDKYLYGPDLGIIPDDGQEDTDAINDALLLAAADEEHDHTLYLPAGVYDLPFGYNNRAICISSDNVKLVMDGKAVLNVGACSAGSYQVMLINGNNVTVRGGQILGERSRHSGSSGAEGHGVYIAGQHVRLEDMQIWDNWGDGVYINDNKRNQGSSMETGSDVVIKGCIISNNRRSNVSVVRGEWIVFDDCDISGAHSSPPSAGINIEPDISGSENDSDWEKKVCHNITFKNCRISAYKSHREWDGTYTRYYAFQINAYYTKAIARAIRLENCTVKGDICIGSCKEDQFILKDTTVTGNIEGPYFR
ncbi:MAG: right-handed parallel beta-helix repeat-containing protein [Lachnospiraceae bacterium]|nr:right-handed parallel beta-helix repeat-containing protein [Lachnospiraceae bacterium]